MVMIGLLVLLNGLVTGAIFAAFLSIHHVGNVLDRHIDLWREIDRQTQYLLEHNELPQADERITSASQSRLLELSHAEQTLEQSIRQRIASTRFIRFMLLSTDEEERTLTESRIHFNIMVLIDNIENAPLALIQLGDSVWDTEAVMALRSDQYLAPLLARATVIAELEERSARSVWWSMILTNALVVLGIWVAWTKWLRARMLALDRALDTEREHAVEHARIEADLHARERELKLILDHIPALVASIDAQGRYLMINQRYRSRLGLNKTQCLAGRQVEAVIGAPNWDCVGPLLERAMAGEYVTCECEIQFKDQPCFMQMICVPIFSSGGSPDRVYAFALDIDERHRIEMALRRSEKYLLTVLNSIGDGVISTNVDGLIVHMNPAAEQLMGWSIDAAMSMTLSEILCLLDERTDERITDPVRFVIDSGAALDVSKGTVLLAANGRRLPVAYRATPIRTDRAEMRGIVLVIRDMSERRERFEQMLYGEKMRAIGHLSGNIANDFNNLLLNITGAAQFLALENDLDIEHDRHLSSIMQTTERAVELTEKLATFAYSNEPRHAVFDVHESIEEITEVLRRAIDTRNTVAVAKCAIDHFIEGSRPAIQSVLLDIGINANHAMPDGGIIKIETRNLTLDAQQIDAYSFDLVPGRYIEIAIIDSGVGIDAEHIGRIFDPFFVIEGPGSGIGLGLSIGYGTIVEHRGAISVQSALGVGSTFRLLLPCVEAPVVESSLPNSNSGQLVSGTGLILLVDDEELLLQSGKEMLETMGYSVMIADNGVQAIEIFEQYHDSIDLVLMDMNMPTMGGAEAIAELKKIDPDCKIMISTGFSEVQTLADANRLGVKSILRKPYRMIHLSEVVASTLEASI